MSLTKKDMKDKDIKDKNIKDLTNLKALEDSGDSTKTTEITENGAENTAEQRPAAEAGGYPDVTAEKKPAADAGLMTEGTIYKQILRFSFPLILGNLFQQLYNMVDSIVVGNFIGGNALAAVGAGAPIINLLIGLFLGLTAGASVVISQFFGAQDSKKVSQTVHTAAAFTIIFGAFLSIFGFFMVNHILRWIHTPDEIFEQSSLYLRVFFSGIIFMAVYNMGASVLRAAGDSRTPLYYLGVTCFLNIILDLACIIVLKMGVEGVALATIVSQAISAVLVVRKLTRSTQSYQLVFKKIRLHPARLKQILIVGIPTGFQQVIISLSNVIVQSYVNSFGAAAVAGWSAYSKLDGILFLPVMSFGLTTTTFTGQNIGAGRLDRVRQGVRVCLLISCSFSILSMIPVYLLGDHILKVFCKEPDVLYYGVYMLRGMIPFYFLLAFVQIFSGAVSGAGHSFASMVVMVSSMCGLRIVVLWLLAPHATGVDFIFIAYIISWAACALCLGIYYLSGRWKKGITENDVH